MTAKKKTYAAADITAKYMEYVLEHEHEPTSVFKFCKHEGIPEDQFYTAAGSFEALRKSIWKQFFDNTHQVMLQADGYEALSAKDKMLTLYYTLFEVLAANRSYVLFSLKGKKDKMKSLKELSELRKAIKGFAGEIIQESNDEKQLRILKHPVSIFSEGAWVQTLFILKYWMDDNSPGFEKTDVAIEKSVRVIFDVFETTPLESIIDFGKFLWKEKMA